MIDTHTHLYMTESFPDGGGAAVERAVAEGVTMMVLPGVDRESVEPLLKLHSLYPEHTAVALGLHPTEVEADWREELRDIMDMGEDVELVGIGETGVDLHWETRYLTRQMDAFGEQLQLAADKNLPVIVHSRDAAKETADVIRAFGSGLPRLVFHSFTAGPEDASLLLKAAPEAYFGINGVITFKNAEPLREAVRRMEPDKIVVETDAPFLAPVPFRGTTNESSYIPYIIKALAAVRGVDEDIMKQTVKRNSLVLFPSLK